MSSFNINGPSNQPIIQGAQNLGQDGGGGGNTGYMNMRNKKKGKEENKEEDNSVFLEEGEDTFAKEGKKENKKENKKSPKFFRAIKDLLKDKKEEEKNKDKDTFTRSIESEEPAKQFAYEDLQNEVPKVFQNPDVTYNDDYYNDVDV